MTRKSILVTGGAGFIGSHLVDQLLSQHHTVTVLDNFSTGRHENLTHHKHLTVIEGDIGNPSDIDKAFQLDIDSVVHLGAVASVAQSVQYPALTHQSNFIGTLNCLEAMRKFKVKRIVYASSAAVYGDQASVPNIEDAPLNPLTPYAADKLSGEYYLDFYRKQYGIEPAIFRFFNIYGPRQDPSSPYSGVISIFVDKARQGLPITVFGDGEQTRDFVFVQDLVRLLVTAVMIPTPPIGAVNVGRGNSYSLNQLITTIETILNSSLVVHTQPARLGDILHSTAHIGKRVHCYDDPIDTTLLEGLTKLLG